MGSVVLSSLPPNKKNKNMGRGPILYTNLHQLLYVVTWIDSPNGFRSLNLKTEKVTEMGPPPKSRFLKNLVYIGLSPLPVTVTTRIITFLVGNPYKPSFATVTGWGGRSKVYKCSGVFCCLSSFRFGDGHCGTFVHLHWFGCGPAGIGMDLGVL